MNMKQNLLPNMVSVVTISLALTILSAFLLLYVNLQNLVASSSRGLSASIYLKDGLSRPAVDRLKKQVAGLPGAMDVTFISKDQALGELKKSLGDQGQVLDSLDQNPLPDILELQIRSDTRNQDEIKGLIQKIQGLTGVTEVHYAWEWADQLKVVARFIKVTGFIIGGLLFLAIVFIVANTIKLTVMAREDELYIMRLMGASEAFVRIPFLIEGLLQGLCGGLVGLVGLYSLFKVVASQIRLPLGLSLVPLTFLPPALSWFMVLAGLTLGFWGSLMSLGRFMQK